MMKSSRYFYCTRALCCSAFVFTPFVFADSATRHHADNTQTGTHVEAALSTTWREEGYTLSAGLWQLPGVLMGGEAYPLEQGISLDEARITVSHRSASGAHGLLQVSSHDNGLEAELHHAYAGFDFSQASLQAGRMASLFSPANGEHSSERLFSETALALDAFFGRQLNDEGARVLFSYAGVELGLETWRGAAFPASSGEDGGINDIFVHYRGQWQAFNWHSGIWGLRAKALNRSDTRYNSSAHSHGNSSNVSAPQVWFDGQTDAAGAFVRTSWAFDHHNSVQFEAQWMQVKPDGTLRDATRITRMEGDYNGGWVQASLRFGSNAERGHEFGVRWEQLVLDNTFSGAAAHDLAQLAGLYNPDHDPTRSTLLYRWQANQNLALRAEWVLDDSVEQSTKRLALGVVWQASLWPGPAH
jgi:hypothetical protein